MSIRRSRSGSPRSARPASTRATLLACCAGGLMGLLAAAPAAAQPKPRPFKVYEQLHASGVPANRARPHGIHHANWRVWMLNRDSVTGQPTVDYGLLYDELEAAAALPEKMLIIDAEGFSSGMVAPPANDQETIEAHREALKAVYAFCKTHFPEVQISYYDHAIHGTDHFKLAGISIIGPYQDVIDQHERNNQRYDSCTETLEPDPLMVWDFMAPHAYPVWSEAYQDYQSYYVQTVMQLMKHYYDDTKPLYAWTSPIYRGSRALPEAYAMRLLEDIAAYADGVIVWHHEDMGTEWEFEGYQVNGGPGLGGSLWDFQQVDDGCVEVGVGWRHVATVTGIDFTGVTSFDDVAEVLETAINDKLNSQPWGTLWPTHGYDFHPGYVDVYFVADGDDPWFPDGLRFHVTPNTDPDEGGLSFPPDELGLSTSIRLKPANCGGTSLLDPDLSDGDQGLLHAFDGFRRRVLPVESDEWHNGWIIDSPWYGALVQFATITPYTLIVDPVDQEDYASDGGSGADWSSPGKAAAKDGDGASTASVLNSQSDICRADAPLDFGSISPESVDGLRVRYRARVASGSGGDPYTLHIHLFEGNSTTPVHTKTARIFNLPTPFDGWIEGAVGGIFDNWGGHVRLDNYTDLRLGFSVSHSTATDGSSGTIAEVDWVGGAELAIDAPIGGPDNHASYANVGGSGAPWNSPAAAISKGDGNLSAIAYCSPGNPSQVARGDAVLDFGSVNAVAVNGLRVRYRALAMGDPYMLNIHLYDASDNLLHTKSALIRGSSWVEGVVGSLVDDWNGAVTLNSYEDLKLGFSISVDSGGTTFALVDFVGDAELGYVPYDIAGPVDHEFYDLTGNGGGTDVIVNPDNAAEEGGGVATAVVTTTTVRRRGSAALDFGNISPSAIHGLRVRYKARRVSGDNYTLHIHLYDGDDGDVLHTKSVVISNTSWTEGTVGGLFDDWGGSITTSNFNDLRLGFSVTHPAFGSYVSSTAEIDWVGNAELIYSP